MLQEILQKFKILIDLLLEGFDDVVNRDVKQLDQLEPLEPIG